MKVEQIYTGCLAHAAYYIENKGEAAIIDPLREVQPYLDRAKLDNAKIKYVFETHFHADFVSGHIDLAKKSGGHIVFGPTASPNYDAIIAEDGQVFEVGDYKIKAIHTPGHTLESTTYLLIDENDHEHGIITGDTLFIGDVGRPDLAQEVVEDLTEEKLAGYLYDSLRNKIMPLSDDLIVYPNHGAGSACGKMMSKETTDTLGNQRKVNYALQPDMAKADFIKAVLQGLKPPPGYFPQNVLMNIKGYESYDKVIEKGSRALEVAEFKYLANESGAVVLDVRHPNDFEKGHIPRSINIGLDGDFAPWVGALIADVQQPILLIAPIDREDEALTRLARIGFDNTLGYLKGSFDEWKSKAQEYDTVTSIEATQLEEIIKENEVEILDVRKEGEYQSQHILSASHICLTSLANRLDKISDNDTVYVHCQGGYRSMIAVSIMKSRGIHNLINITGGFNAIQQTGIPLSEYVCPSSLL